MSALPAWFKPTVSFPCRGREWIGSTHFCFAAVDPVPEGLKHPNGARTMDEWIGSVVGDVRTWVHVRGYGVFGEHAFAAHYLTACESAHTGIAWRLTGGRDITPAAVGFVDGAPVAVVMGIRPYGPIDEAKEIGPLCDACEGDGRSAECAECGGTGEVECSLGHDHECDDCDGNGRAGFCDDCAGTGIWRAPA